MKGASLIAISEPKKSLDFQGFGQNPYGTGVKNRAPSSIPVSLYCPFKKGSHPYEHFIADKGGSRKSPIDLC